MLTPLDDRYRYVESIRSGERAIAWLAEDLTSGRRLVAAPIGASRVAGYESIRGLSHPHLAAIVDVIRAPDQSVIPDDLGALRPAAVVLAEYVPGQNLHDRMKGSQLSLRDAVTLLVGVVQAVAQIHERKMAHGAISPRTIVVEPAVARPSPVLTQLAAPTSGTYSSRERLQRRGASLEDDSWALHATLFTALTGVAPFAGLTREELIKSMLSGEPRPISAHGIEAPELEQILVRGLVHNPRWRPSVADLGHTLEHWLETQAEPGAESRPVMVPSASGAGPLASIPPVPYYDSDSMRPPAVEKASAAAPIAETPKPEAVAPDAAKLEAPQAEAPKLETPKPELPKLETPPLPAVPRAPSTPPAATISNRPPASAPPESGRSVSEPAPAARLERVEPAARAETEKRTSNAPSSKSAATAAPPGPVAEASGAAVPTKANASTPPNTAKTSDKPPSASAPGPAPDQRSERKPSAPSPTSGEREDLLLSMFEQEEAGRRRGRIGIVIGLIAIVIGGGWVVRRTMRVRPAAPVATSTAAEPSALASTSASAQPSASAATSASAAPAESPAPSRAGDPGKFAPAERLACVSGLLGEGSLTPDAEVEFVCGDRDLKSIAGTLTARLILAAKGRPTPPMTDWNDASWYQLAISAVVRARCCASEPVALPKPRGDCEPLDDRLKAVAAVVNSPSGGGQSTALDDFDAAVRCFYAKGVPRPYPYGKPIKPVNRAAFDRFRTRVQAKGASAPAQEPNANEPAK